MIDISRKYLITEQKGDNIVEGILDIFKKKKFLSPDKVKQIIANIDKTKDVKGLHMLLDKLKVYKSIFSEDDLSIVRDAIWERLKELQ